MEGQSPTAPHRTAQLRQDRMRKSPRRRQALATPLSTLLDQSRQGVAWMLQDSRPIHPPESFRMKTPLPVTMHCVFRRESVPKAGTLFRIQQLTKSPAKMVEL